MKSSCVIFLAAFLVLCAVTTDSAGGASRGSRLRSLPPKTRHAFDQSVDESQQDYTYWEAQHHYVPQNSSALSCSAKYNETISGLNNELLDLSNNVTSNPVAQKNLTAYAEEQVQAAESERIRCLDTLLKSIGQASTGHFALSLPYVFFVLFSIFSLL